MEKSIGELLGAFPFNYAGPLWEALLRSPAHYIIEAVLLLIIAYIVLFKKTYDPSKRGYGARSAVGLSDKEKEELIAEWEPEPLVPRPEEPFESLPPLSEAFTIARFVPGGRNVVVELEGKGARPFVSFCSSDFLGLGDRREVRAAGDAALEEYTLGSCGPRGFYGSTRLHLELERELAAFFGTPESITYSDAVATLASAIPAFAKRGDLLLVDAGVNAALLMGARLSRSKVTLFRHNDLEDLRRQLELVRASDATRKDNSLLQRRFIVVEGLYANYGDLCPLPALTALAREFKWRVMLDDSLGLGTLGASGRGALERAGLSVTADELHAPDVHVLLGSLATTLASVGGFCVGSREVVDHQRLSGAGYCFSASAPPFLCATATAALRLLARESASLLPALAARAEAAHAALAAALGGSLRLISEPASPVKHALLALGAFGALPHAVATAKLFAGAKGAGGPALPELSPANARATARARALEERVLHALVRAVAEEGVLLTFTHYAPADHIAPRPTLKISLSLAHSDAELAALVAALGAALAGDRLARIIDAASAAVEGRAVGAAVAP